MPGDRTRAPGPRLGRVTLPALNGISLGVLPAARGGGSIAPPPEALALFFFRSSDRGKSDPAVFSEGGEFTGQEQAEAETEIRGGIHGIMEAVGEGLDLHPV